MSVPDFELPDENGEVHKLSELQAENPMILLLGRGEHCPRERQHQKELIKLAEWCAVGFTNMVTILPGSGDGLPRTSSGRTSRTCSAGSRTTLTRRSPRCARSGTRPRQSRTDD